MVECRNLSKIFHFVLGAFQFQVMHNFESVLVLVVDLDVEINAFVNEEYHLTKLASCLSIVVMDLRLHKIAEE